jgi:hypothetical protein
MGAVEKKNAVRWTLGCFKRLRSPSPARGFPNSSTDEWWSLPFFTTRSSGVKEKGFLF